MSNLYEMPEEKSVLLSKVKKGQKIYQNIIYDKLKPSKVNYLNKFVNAREKKDNNNKNNSNYTEQYHKRVKSNYNYNLNTIKDSIKNDDEDQGYNRTKNGSLYYDYLFSVYNEMNKNNDNTSIINHPKMKSRNLSAKSYVQTSIREDEY